MNRALANILPALQLTRIALVFTAIADIWLVVLLSAGLGLPTTAIRPLPVWAMLLCTGAVATGMYAFGMALNDVMDVRRDRTFAPERPIPAGRMGFGRAVVVAVAALLLAVAGSVPLGRISTLLCLGCAALVLFYDTLGKHLPGVGVVTLGLIRAVHMLIANPSLGYCWPVWLTLSHVIGISAAGHRLEGKRPCLTGRSIWGVVGSWAFLTVALIAWMGNEGVLRLPGYPWLWVGPTAAALLFLGMALNLARHNARRQMVGGLLIKRGLLWLIIYDAAWLAGAGLWIEAIAIAALLPAALLTMSVIRQLKALTEPTGFRREA